LLEYFKMTDFLITCPVATAIPQIIPGDMDRKYLAETVSRRDAAAEPPWMGLLRVFGGDTQSMPIIFVGQQWL
jgi:hypothetical protein